jgi:WD40 repeat protein
MRFGVVPVFLIGIVILIGPVLGQDDNRPHFGGEIVVLGFADNQLMNEPDLSPDGTLVFTHAAAYGRRLMPPQPYLGATQYLWELGETGTGGDLRYLPPAQQWQLDDTEFGHGYAFSPDGQYLVVGTPTELQIRTLPEMTVFRTAPIIVNISYPPTSYISWSADSRYIATMMDHDIVVWDIITDQVLRYTLDWQYEEVTPIGVGWFGEYRGPVGQPEEDGFYVCTLRLESCTDYHFAEFLVATLARSGDLILTYKVRSLSNEGASIQIWQHQRDSTYESKEITLSTKDVGCPRWFSADDRYLGLACSRNAWSISEFPSFAPVHSFPDNEKPTWIEGTEWIVTFNPFELSLNLYRLGTHDPLDTLSLVEHFGEEIRDLRNSEVVTTHYPDVSEDGRRVLITLGWAALVVPIEYE